MRCPNCNKFVSYDEPECETSSVDLSGPSVTLDCRVVLKCSGCGEELKDNEFNECCEIEHRCEKSESPEFEMESEGDPEPSDRFETKDRNGKEIKLSRYQTHLIGFTQDVQVKCTSCEEIITVTIGAESAASSFNELV